VQHSSSRYLSILQQDLRAEVKQNVCGFSCWYTQNLQTQVSMEMWMCLHKLVHFNRTLLGQLPRTQQALQMESHYI